MADICTNHIGQVFLLYCK